MENVSYTYRGTADVAMPEQGRTRAALTAFGAPGVGFPATQSHVGQAAALQATGGDAFDG